MILFNCDFVYIVGFGRLYKKQPRLGPNNLFTLFMPASWKLLSLGENYFTIVDIFRRDTAKSILEGSMYNMQTNTSMKL